jgi:hypothetical protein
MQQPQQPTMQAKDTYYAIMTDRLDKQFGTLEALDNKLAAIFGFSNVTAGIFAALLTTTGDVDWSKATLAAVILVGFAYVGVVLSAYQTYQVTQWSLRPNYDDLKSYCAQYPDDVMKEWVADECYESLRKNEPIIKRKADFLWWTVFFTAIQALAILGAGASVVVD